MTPKIEYETLDILKHINNHLIDLINLIKVMDKRLIKITTILKGISLLF